MFVRLMEDRRHNQATEALSKYATDTQRKTQLEIANLNARVSMRNVDVQSATSIRVAQINQATAITAASIGAAASRYATDVNAQVSRDNTRDNNYTKEQVAQKSFNAAIGVAQMKRDIDQQKVDNDYWLGVRKNEITSEGNWLGFFGNLVGSSTKIATHVVK